MSLRILQKKKKLQGLAEQWKPLSQKTELPDLTLVSSLTFSSQLPHLKNVHRDS